MSEIRRSSTGPGNQISKLGPSGFFTAGRQRDLLPARIHAASEHSTLIKTSSRQSNSRATVAVMNGITPASGQWQEARHTDGRVYYYNTQTKATQWTKPEELMTPAEVRSHQQTSECSY